MTEYQEKSLYEILLIFLSTCSSVLIAFFKTLSFNPPLYTPISKLIPTVYLLFLLYKQSIAMVIPFFQRQWPHAARSGRRLVTLTNARHAQLPLTRAKLLSWLNGKREQGRGKFRIPERISGKDWFELYFSRLPDKF